MNHESNGRMIEINKEKKKKENYKTKTKTKKTNRRALKKRDEKKEI